DPADALGVLGPESVGIADRMRIHLLVLGLIDPGAALPLRRHVVDLLGHHILLAASEPVHGTPSHCYQRLCVAAPCPDKAEALGRWLEPAGRTRPRRPSRSR